MGGSVIFKFLQCHSTLPSSTVPRKYGLPRPYKQAVLRKTHIQQQPKNQKDSYVHIDVNDGIVALSTCESGPGSSYPLEEFLSHVERRSEKIGDAVVLNEDAADRFPLLHQ